LNTRASCIACGILLLQTACFSAPSHANPPKWVNLFDGRTLTGWHAVPSGSQDDWSVRDGAIVGRGSQNRLSYLVWKEMDLADFELTLRYRIHGQGNSGIEIRAMPDPSGKRPFVGYHADLGHVGIGPHILGAWDFHFTQRNEPACLRGTRLTLQPDGSLHRETIQPPLPLSAVHRNHWNRVRILARGNQFEFFINGKLASAFCDQVTARHFQKGRIGLQIHDAGTRVEFKDIRLRKIKAQNEKRTKR